MNEIIGQIISEISSLIVNITLFLWGFDEDFEARDHLATVALSSLLLSFIAILIIFYRYRKKIEEELSEFARRKFVLTLGIFLSATSIAFIAETNNHLL